MATESYNQFCPTSLACSMLEPRWTILVLCQLWCGATRFNEIQRNLPGMSPSLLTKRLKEMEGNGLVERLETSGSRQVNYLTTPLADELEPIIHALGSWAHRNLDPEVQLEVLDSHLLMWNIRRKIDVQVLPRKRWVVQFTLSQPNEPQERYWLLVEPNGDTDLCVQDPKRDVDLYILADLKALTSAWMGHTSFSQEIENETIQLIGDTQLARSLSKWLVRSAYAYEADERRSLDSGALQALTA